MRTPRWHGVKPCFIGYVAVREPRKISRYAEYGARALARAVGVLKKGVISNEK